MKKRISEILLVSSPYDLYLMEEEGLLSDRISDAYALLHLTHTPNITRVSSAGDALEAVKNSHFDMVISGMRVGKSFNAFDMARSIKSVRPGLPLVLISPEMRNFENIIRKSEACGIDKIFCWHGDARLFLAIIKIFEDRFNAEHDCLEEQIRAIILVEDSPHFYSAYLPLIYTELVQQTRALAAEGTSDEEKLLQMRSRPKILMAHSYEEATALYECYRANILGVISDEEDLVELAHCTPMAFFHDIGEYDKELKGYRIDLSRKILIFLDQPHNDLLARLRPLLSHDEKEIKLKITDKSQKHGLRTKNVILKGYPSVIFCTAGLRIDEQEATRFLLLSPDINQEKIREGVLNTLRRESDRDQYDASLQKDK